MLLLQILGLDPLVAVLAIAIPFGAIVAKVFSEILDEPPHAPLGSLLQAGVPSLQALLYGLLPQALPNLLSYSFYRFECSLRSAYVLGLVGAGAFTDGTNQQLRLWWAGLTLGAFVGLTLGVDLMSRRMRQVWR